MLFMVIEKFKDSDAKAVYDRYQKQGRMLPAGLEYMQSWVTTSYEGCFQLMRTDDVRLIDEWTMKWEDLVEFEVIAVLTSEEAAEQMQRQSEGGGSNREATRKGVEGGVANRTPNKRVQRSANVRFT
jgi:hypothetical protein